MAAELCLFQKPIVKVIEWLSFHLPHSPEVVNVEDSIGLRVEVGFGFFRKFVESFGLVMRTTSIDFLVPTVKIGDARSERGLLCIE